MPVVAPTLASSLAQLIGYAVLLGSLFRSFPQILRIMKSKSVEGISLSSQITEVCCYTISWAYFVNRNYDFSTYGDVVSCWFQTLIIIGMIVVVGKTEYNKAAMAALAAAFLGAGYWMMSCACGMEVLTALQACTALLMAVGAKIPQIWMNLRRGNSGELSLITCGLSVAGNVARIFTTIVLTKDVMLLWSISGQAVLNSILFAQTVLTFKATQQQKIATA